MRKELLIKKLCVLKNKTLAVAESCSGGLFSHKLTNVSGCSKYFKSGIIAYSNEAKINILKVPSSVIKEYGAVSKETAVLMAKGVKKIAKTDIGLAITGIAGPSGAAISKPAGTVYIAAKSNKKIICKKFNFRGTRLSIKKQSANAALECVLSLL